VGHLCPLGSWYGSRDTMESGSTTRPSWKFNCASLMTVECLVCATVRYASRLGMRHVLACVTFWHASRFGMRHAFGMRNVLPCVTVWHASRFLSRVPGAEWAGREEEAERSHHWWEIQKHRACRKNQVPRALCLYLRYRYWLWENFIFFSDKFTFWAFSQSYRSASRRILYGEDPVPNLEYKYAHKNTNYTYFDG
jgi:hypothetical protein